MWPRICIRRETCDLVRKTLSMMFCWLYFFENWKSQDLKQSSSPFTNPWVWHSDSNPFNLINYLHNEAWKCLYLLCCWIFLHMLPVNEIWSMRMDEGTECFTITPGRSHVWNVHPGVSIEDNSTPLLQSLASCHAHL